MTLAVEDLFRSVQDLELRQAYRQTFQTFDRNMAPLLTPEAQQLLHRSLVDLSQQLPREQRDDSLRTVGVDLGIKFGPKSWFRKVTDEERKASLYAVMKAFFAEIAPLLSPHAWQHHVADWCIQLSAKIK